MPREILLKQVAFNCYTIEMVEASFSFFRTDYQIRVFDGDQLISLNSYTSQRMAEEMFYEAAKEVKVRGRLR